MTEGAFVDGGLGSIGGKLLISIEERVRYAFESKFIINCPTIYELCTTRKSVAKAPAEKG